jgi:arylsulfatase
LAQVVLVLGCSDDGETLASGSRVRGAAEAAPSIVLITLDTTRADHLPTYGYFRDTAPALDALAAESIVFERLIVPMATTLPTHLSILTGTYPLEHGVLANSTQGGRRFVPSSRLQSFATLSQRAGYTTAAFVSAAPLKTGSGAETGFDVFDQSEEKMRNAEATTDAALSWLAGHDDEPFFLWIHYYDAHYPFEPPGEYAKLYATDDGLKAFIAERDISPIASRPLTSTIDVAEDVANLYDGEIRYVDDQMARVLEALRARTDWPTTAVVVAGDHGEGLCQHGLSAHGSTWNEQLNAPLVMRLPNEEPRRVKTLLSAIDVLTTLAGSMELPQSSEFESQATGRNVLAADFEPRAVLSQDTGRERRVKGPYRYALSGERFKFFRLEHEDGRIEEELYDLQRDPFELSNVADRNPDKLAELRETLALQLTALEQRGRELRGADEPTTRPADREVLEQLNALGYLVDDEEPAEPIPDAGS